ncbi:MAG: hypothetical protein VB096_08745 [Pseudoflavonifractor sp.]|nr:hypothetical protein [Pseudoflavonifractor sp.]
MDKNAKQLKAVKERQEEAALNRVLCWIAGGAVLEFLLLLLNRYYNHYTVDQIELRVALGTAVKILAVAALACAAAGAFWWNSARKSQRRTTLPGILTLLLAGVSLSCFVVWLFDGLGLRLMYLAVPCAIVLVMIYYLYQHEFFLVACVSALALLGTWVSSKGLGGVYAALTYVVVMASALLVLGGAILCRKAQINGGAVEYQGNKIRIFSKDTNYALLYLSIAIALVVLVAAALGVATVILRAVAVAWLLIMAVYYTMKLM